MAVPLALAPMGAGATDIPITTSCALIEAGVCNATAKLASPGSSSDVIQFQGGALTLDGAGTPMRSRPRLM